MEPIRINLVKKKNIRGRILIGFTVLFIASTIAMTFANIYEYVSNSRLIRTYEARLQLVKKQSTQLKNKSQDKLAGFEHARMKKDTVYLDSILIKHLFPIPGILTAIEKVKPEPVDINSLSFLEDLGLIKITGSSFYPDDVSEFIRNLNRSGYFKVALSREEVIETGKIQFDLTARWVHDTHTEKI